MRKQLKTLTWIVAKEALQLEVDEDKCNTSTLNGHLLAFQVSNRKRATERFIVQSKEHPRLNGSEAFRGLLDCCDS